MSALNALKDTSSMALSVFLYLISAVPGIAIQVDALNAMLATLSIMVLARDQLISSLLILDVLPGTGPVSNVSSAPTTGFSTIKEFVCLFLINVLPTTQLEFV